MGWDDLMPYVDHNSSTPLYEQIKLILRSQILDGEFKPDDWLPTERELCDLYGVSRITVVRALNELELEGFVKRIQGKGTLVASRRIEETLNTIYGFSKSMQQQGLNVTSRLLSVKHIENDPNLSHVFRLPSDYSDGFLRIRRLRFVDNIPAAVFTTFVTHDIGRQLAAYDLERYSLYELYHTITGSRIVSSEVSLVPIVATPEIIQLFDVKPGTAHFWHRSVSYIDEHQPIETMTAIFRGDMFEFKSSLHAAEEDAHPRSPWFVREEAMASF
jgi:GntR family transcriptional regulator